MWTELAGYRVVGVVCAHPDDETFGLGALIAGLIDRGARIDLVCLTRGEQSTLGAGDDLAGRRAAELGEAAAVLGIDTVVLHDHPDGALTTVPLEVLTEEVTAGLGDADVLLTFDEGGITGHPDHQRATEAAIAAGATLDLPVLGWALPQQVATTLTAEFGAQFVGRTDDDLDLQLHVDRTRQHIAMACHASQDGPVPSRRIQLQGPVEHLRVLRSPQSGDDPYSTGPPA